MTADKIILDAERAAQEYSDDPRIRLAFQCGILQGHIKRMDAEIATLKEFQQNDMQEILNLTRELIEKDI